MNVINFYDTERNLIIQFKRFSLIKNSVINTIDFIGKIDIDFFHLNTDFTAELSDFRTFSIKLKDMYDGKIKYAKFNPLSIKITISFLLKDNGQILVENIIFNDMSTCEFKFKYVTDQSFLPDLIMGIENMLKVV